MTPPAPSWPPPSAFLHTESYHSTAPLLSATSRRYCSFHPPSCCSSPSSRRSTCSVQFVKFGTSASVHPVTSWTVRSWPWFFITDRCFWFSKGWVAAFGVRATFLGWRVVCGSWSRFGSVIFSWFTFLSHRRWTTACVFIWVTSFRLFFVCRCSKGFCLTRTLFPYWFMTV